MKISDELLTQTTNAIESVGIESFVLLVPPDEDERIGVMMNKISLSKATSLISSSLALIIEKGVAVEGHEEGYHEIFGGFRREYLNLVKKVNRKIAAWNVAHPKKDES